ncbi:hypothetical protein [Neisseria bergeri]|uniref:hypothetical protein n=1 Tax=Neisseria bergeri TaxID=1906581 RepID=UPI000E57AF39|nr:hypothetical protein [Neisseria bergeri]MBH2124609.1 hypothetical protein [Neisseria meningitidis]
MNKETAEEIQCGFEYLAFDDLTPIFFAPLGREPQTWQWQFAVEFIYRLLVCELAILWPFTFDKKQEIFLFCQEFAKQNPFGTENNELWYSGEITLTKKGLDLVKFYIPELFECEDLPFELNHSFILALESIFSDYEVPWEENNPLIPIKILDNK